MKVIVCGTRGFYSDENLYSDFLDEFDALPERVDELVHGGCPNSPDLFARDLGEADDIPVKCFPAKWETHGKQAGFLRNWEMAEYVRDNGGGYLIAVWDGKSSGTKNMIIEAVQHGLGVRIIPC